MPKHLRLLLILLPLAAALSPAYGQDTLRTTQLVVFKNGIGFFLREGNVPAPGGTYRLPRTPEAVFGTLWADAPGNGIQWMSAIEDTLASRKPFTTTQELMAANIGKRIRVRVRASLQEPVQTVEGTLATASPGYFGIRTAAGGLTVFDAGTLAQYEFLDMPRLDQKTDSLAWGITLRFASAAQRQQLRLYYLSRQTGWVPSYRVELLPDHRARVQLRATLVNDAEALQNTNIRFTVGVPNFKFQNTDEALSARQAFTQLLGAMAPAAYYLNANVMANNAVFAQRAMAAGEAQSYDDAPASGGQTLDVEGSQAQDLYFYEIKNISLPKGGRGVFSLLDIQVPYEDLFECELPANTGYEPQPLSGPEADKSETVWHSVRLKNTGNSPWTTGTALVMDQTGTVLNPISQDKLNYTPANERTLLRLTQVPGLTVKEAEEVTARQEEIRLRDRNVYDRITVKATVHVTNTTGREVKLTLRRLVAGETVESSTPWKVTTLPQGQYGGANPLQRIEWEPVIKAGESVDVTYSYKMYVLRRTN